MKRQEPPIAFVSDPTPPEQRDRYDRRRWTKHSIEKLPQGFSLVDDGRSAYLYLREGDRLFELYTEFAGASSLDIVAYSTGLSTSISIANRTRTPILPEEQDRIRKEMEGWLKARSIRYTID